MRIVNEYPPNIDAIDAAFKTRDVQGVVYCYGDAIYNPFGIDVPKWIVDHEIVHSARQGDDPAGWWVTYIADPKFRFDEELLGHIEEYRSFCAEYSRNRAARRTYLTAIAKRLAGPVYGNIVSVDRAKAMIKTAQRAEASPDLES